MQELGLPVKINLLPNEIEKAIPFDQDEEHRSYDPEYANRFWRVLLQSHRVFTEFRSRFCGKCSPVHFFWGSFDLAVTRFSGRQAPPHPGGVPHLPDVVAREAYSQEVSSLGFWPGNAAMPTPIFYSYAYPEPAGFSQAEVSPAGGCLQSQTCTNLPCLTTRCGQRTPRMKSSSGSRKAPMMRLRPWRSGIALPSRKRNPPCIPPRRARKYRK